ncbi:ATP-binding protein, partial [Nonomuraea sp. NPDC049784]
AEESAALNTAVRLAADAAVGDPIIPDVISVLRQGPQPLRERILATRDSDYIAATRSLISALENLIGGPLAGMFDRPTSVQLDLSRPALSLDVSVLRSAGEHVAAAGLLACWAYSYGAVDIARAFGVLPRPLVLPLDEMWKVLRSGPGMVDAMDAITRLNRSHGEISLMSTHSVRDLEALPTEEDRAKAAGLMERCDILILAAMSVGELRRISAQKALTSAEIDLIASWAASTSTGLDGTTQIHPGRGKYLIKIGQRLGVPVRMQLTPLEQRLYYTDGAIHTPGARSGGGHAR